MNKTGNVVEGRYKKVGVQYTCGCVKYWDGQIVPCDEHAEEVE